MSEIQTENKPSLEAVKEPGKKFGGRGDLLARSGKLAEAEVDVDGVTYIVRELSGTERAQVIGLQAKARIQGTVDLVRYQEQLLLYGVCDPESPEGAREPALVQADLAQVMRNGAGFLDPILEKIEELSGLSVDVEKAAQSDSPLDSTRNGSSTSGSLGS